MALLIQDGSYLVTQKNSAPIGKLLLKGDPGAVYHMIAPTWRRADFGNGTTSVAWTSPLDPSELKAFTIDASTELDGIADKIAMVDLTLSGLAAIAGLRIYGVTNDDRMVTVWFNVDEAERAKPAWNPPGETHTITCTITSMNGHIFERTVSLRISQT